MLSSSFFYGPPLCADLRPVISIFRHLCCLSTAFVNHLVRPLWDPRGSSRTYHVSQKQSKEATNKRGSLLPFPLDSSSSAFRYGASRSRPVSQAPRGRPPPCLVCAGTCSGSRCATGGLPTSLSRQVCWRGAKTASQKLS